VFLPTKFEFFIFCPPPQEVGQNFAPPLEKTEIRPWAAVVVNND